MNKPEKLRVFHDVIYPDNLDEDFIKQMLRETIVHESEKRFRNYSVVGSIHYWREPIKRKAKNITDYRYFAETWIKGE